MPNKKVKDETRFTEVIERFMQLLPDSVIYMDSADRCVVSRRAGLGVIKLRNGRRAEIQLGVVTDKEDWIKGR